MASVVALVVFVAVWRVSSHAGEATAAAESAADPLGAAEARVSLDLTHSEALPSGSSLEMAFYEEVVLLQETVRMRELPLAVFRPHFEFKGKEFGVFLRLSTWICVL